MFEKEFEALDVSLKFFERSKRSLKLVYDGVVKGLSDKGIGMTRKGGI